MSEWVIIIVFMGMNLGGRVNFSNFLYSGTIRILGGEDMPRRKTARILSDDDKHQAGLTPQQQGESSISGSTPDPESDDNVLDAAKQAGLYEDQDEEHPGELNIAKEIEKDEKEHLEKD